MNKCQWNCLSDSEKEKAFKMYIDSITPINVTSTITLLRVIHDGKNVSYLFPGQFNKEICDISVQWYCEHGISEKQIKQFVERFGLTGIRSIQVFTNKNKQITIIC